MPSVELTGVEALFALTHRWLGGVSESLWPGFAGAEAPMAVYTPGRRALLFGHPSPPPEFAPVETGLGQAMMLEGSSPRLAANTSLDLGGVQTTCVMTTSVGPSDCLLAEIVALVTHEAFHSFEFSGSFVGDMDVSAFMSYPADDPVNNALSQVENELIIEAQAIWPAAEALELVRRYLAVRRRRVSRLRPEHAEFEDRLDRFEGTAQYVALRLLSDLAAGTVDLPDELTATAADTPAADRRLPVDEQVAAWRASRDELLRRSNIRGAGGVWARTYEIGAFKGLVLDRLLPDWKSLVAAGTAPNRLLEEALRAVRGAEPDLSEVLTAGGYERRLADDLAYVSEKRQKESALLASFDPATRPLVIIDLAGHAAAGPFATDGNYSMDPLNTLQLPDGRRVHQRMYFLNRFDLRIESQASPPVPVLEDRQAWRIAFPSPAGMRLTEGEGAVVHAADGFAVSVPQCRVLQEGLSYRLVV